jgi:hypothetical protein
VYAHPYICQYPLQLMPTGDNPGVRLVSEAGCAAQPHSCTAAQPGLTWAECAYQAAVRPTRYSLDAIVC